MANSYKRFLTNNLLPGRPAICFDLSRRTLVHVYEHIPLQTSNFQTEVNYYLNRKESYSGNVVVINKIKDQQITYNLGRAAMEISIVTDYVPWRLHLESSILSRQQALFLLDGACRGFRQLLHRVRTPFIVQSNMLGIDFKGQVKVWWNQLYYRSNFGFVMNQNVKLKDMVKSLIHIILAKMNQGQAKILEEELICDQSTFVNLSQKIRQISSGLNLKDIGKSLISTKEDYQVAMRESGLINNNSKSVIIEPLKLSSISQLHRIPSQRVILSPRKEGPLEFSKVITKRTYRGTSPTIQEKMQIIKNDIENLRTVAQNSTPVPAISNSQVKMRSSRSVDALFSYNKGLKGDTNIPQISRVIKESTVEGQKEDLTVSRFVNPISKSTTSILGPDNCAVCSNLQELRRSQVNGKQAADPLFLSRLQNLVGTDKSINSTSRSMNESRLQKNMSSENTKIRFGESEKKLPQSMYFTSLFDM